MRGATKQDIEIQTDFISSVIQLLSNFEIEELKAINKVLIDIRKKKYTLKNKKAIYTKYCEYQQKKVGSDL